jgi:outer membrane protein TolC
VHAAIACAGAILAANGYAQLPSAPSAPWIPPAQLNLHTPTEASPLPGASAHNALSLADLIDIAERRNPETRAAWERAKGLLARKGVARSALYPTLTGLVIGETTRNGFSIVSLYARRRASWSPRWSSTTPSLTGMRAWTLCGLHVTTSSRATTLSTTPTCRSLIR